MVWTPKRGEDNSNKKTCLILFVCDTSVELTSTLHCCHLADLSSQFPRTEWESLRHRCRAEGKRFPCGSVAWAGITLPHRFTFTMPQRLLAQQRSVKKSVLYPAARQSGTASASPCHRPTLCKTVVTWKRRNLCSNLNSTRQAINKLCGWVIMVGHCRPSQKEEYMRADLVLFEYYCLIPLI